MSTMTLAERAAVSAVLGLLWAWLVIQETGLADRWDALAVILDAVILVASVGLCYGGLLFLERMTNGHHPASDSDSEHRRDR